MMLYKHMIMHVLTWHALGAGGLSLHTRLSCAGITMQMTLPVVLVVLLATLLMEMRSFPRLLSMLLYFARPKRKGPNLQKR